jgi:basic membrane protein A
VAHAVASGSFSGGTEWKPAVDWMWLLKAGSNGHYNPRLVSTADWAGFQKTWSDLAAGRIEVPA